MSGKWESISFADLIAERKNRFEPDAPEIHGLPKIDKIDFAEGRLHLGEYEPTKTQQIIVEPGDFVFSGLNIEKGAAGFNETGSRLVVSANYSTCSYNDSRVSLDFFKHYMRSENFQKLLKANLKKDYGFTRPKHLMPLTFLVPADKAEQNRIVGEYESCKATHSELSAEITHQQSLLAKLKQAIRQEAIQGKLTADWRAAHPEVELASQLLRRIQDEKARLIAAKKLRPEKPLPKITPAEIPFEIPKGWEWCRLGDLCRKVTDGFHNTPPKAEKGFPYIAATHVKSDGIDWANAYRVDEKNHRELHSKTEPQKGEILVVNIGAGSGCPAIIDVDFEFSFKNTAILKFNQELLSNRHIFNYLRHIQPENYARLTRGANQPFLSLKVIKEFVFPLPPLAEQAAIVERVEALMKTCRALEAEIEHARTHAANLLQAVLKEAFATSSA